jgi:hypothetical protein
MARQVTITTVCDVCLTDDNTEPAEELPPLNLPEVPGKAKVLALCEVHRKEFYDPLVRLLAALGQAVDESGEPAVKGVVGAPKKGKGGSKLGVGSVLAKAPAAKAEPAGKASGKGKVTCPACKKHYANESALSSHVRLQHDTTLAALRGEPTPFTCPECGNTYGTGHGLGAHRFRKHGVQGTSKSSKAAKDASKGATTKEAPQAALEQVPDLVEPDSPVAV